MDAALGITAGTLTGTFALPTNLTGGLGSDLSGIKAQDSVFTLNGTQLTRKTNVVSDAAEGVTFTLKQGGQTGTTTLTVAQDKATATAGMQDLLTKFNALVKTYKDASTATQDPNGTILPAPLSGDATSRDLVAQIRSTLTGASAGLSSTATFQNASSLGVKTNSDGTLTLNTVTFQAAIDKDPAAIMRLFTFTGSSSNGVVAFQGAGNKTATGSVGFTITSASGGFQGTFTGTANGLPFSINLTSSNGIMAGAVGTPLEGLSLSVTGTGTGVLTLSRGVGQAASDLISKFTAYGSGSLATALTNIQNQNKSLVEQIAAGQSALDQRKKILQAQFAKMETVIGQLKAAGGSLSTM
jgi:flagellar hook-associated protein 2